MKKLLAQLTGLYFNLLVFFAPRAAGRKGFYLFCTPQRPPLRGHQLKFLDTAEKSSFLCDGVRIQVYRWGTGEKSLLFLHGWQSHSFRWKNYIESFSKKEYTIYAFDAPGHGLSGGRYTNLPIYSNVLETFLNLIQPIHTIVGHSLGSFTALYTFYRLKTLPVKQLVITATPGEVSEFVEFYRQVLGLSSRTINAIRQSFLQIIHNLPEYYSAAKFAAAVDIPGFIIHDAQDDEAPFHHAHAIHKAWANSRIVSTAGLGHNLRSISVVRQVVDFVNEQSTGNQNAKLDLNVLQNLN